MNKENNRKFYKKILKPFFIELRSLTIKNLKSHYDIDYKEFIPGLRKIEDFNGKLSSIGIFEKLYKEEQTEPPVVIRHSIEITRIVLLKILSSYIGYSYHNSIQLKKWKEIAFFEHVLENLSFKDVIFLFRPFYEKFIVLSEFQRTLNHILFYQGSNYSRIITLYIKKINESSRTDFLNDNNLDYFLERNDINLNLFNSITKFYQLSIFLFTSKTNDKPLKEAGNHQNVSLMSYTECFTTLSIESIAYALYIQETLIRLK